MHFLPVAREEILPEIRNAVGNKERGEDVNGIMEVPEERYDGEEKGYQEKWDPDGSAVPEDECDEEGKPRMARKEKVSPRTEPTKEVIQINRYRVGCWADMGQRHEYGADNDKKGDTFNKKDEAAWVCYAYCSNEPHHNNASINERAVEVEHGNPVQEEVGGRITGVPRGEIDRHMVDDKACREE